MFSIYKRIENIARKGENAGYMHFIQIFQKTSFSKSLKSELYGIGLTHYQTTNFRLSKLKEFADDNFKFDENVRKLSIQVENTVGKGEIARHEKFLLFPQCFQKACFPRASKGVIVWEWVNH